MSRLMTFVCSQFLAGLIALPVSGADLEPLRYNHPGLKVDLGAGLWAWPLPMDYDGDGDLDLVVSCPDVPSNGTWFFENPDGNVTMPVFKPAVKIGPGFHNIRVSQVDGVPRVLVPGAEYSDFLKSGFEKKMALGLPAGVLGKDRKLRANLWHLVDHNGDGKQDLVVAIGDWKDYGWDDAWNERGEWKNGPLRGLLFVYDDAEAIRQGKKVEPVQLMAGDRPMETYGWPQPCFADFDGDGDLDIICGEFLDRFTWFENTGTRTAPKYAAGKFLKHGDNLLKMDLQMIVPTPIDWDRDGDVDLICGDEDGRVAFLEHTGRITDRMPVFQPPRYFQQQADRVKCGALATPFCVDWDGDGDEDLLSGNTAGYVEFFENLGIADGSDMPRWAAPVRLRSGDQVLRVQAGPNGSIQGPCEAKWGYTCFTIADWDHDGRLDLMMNTILGKILWFARQKDGLHLSEARPVDVEWSGPTPKPSWTWWNPEGKELVTQWRTTPVMADMTNDGLMDLAMLDHEGYLALFERQKRGEQLVLQPGRRVFIDENGQTLRLNPGHAGKSGRRKLHLTDWDRDGDLDLLINSRNADLLENTGSRNGLIAFTLRGALGERSVAGHTSSPCTALFRRGATQRELLVGAEDGFFYFQSR